MQDRIVTKARGRTGSAFRSILAAMLAVAFGPLGSTIALAQNDVILFGSGDRLTGEIKGLDRGKISFDTPATGVIELEWNDIEQLISPTSFELILDTGEELFGTLVESATPGEILVQTEAATRSLPILTIVRMTPIRSTLLDRIEMSVDAGYSLAKANNLEQTNFGYDFRYREQARQLTLGLDSSLSSSESDESSNRVFASFYFRRFLDRGNWDPFAIGQLERNDELGIDRRQTFGGGMSRWLRDTNSSRIAFGGGLVATSEDDFGATETKKDTEALLGVDLEWFRFDEPELDVSMQLNVYRRLSGSGEPRSNLDVSLRWEIFSDFFWGLSVYYTYDAQSDTEEPTTDYGTFTSLGWKF
jgi:Protein of unknown function, DUF481